MALWEYQINKNDFNLDAYPPLRVSSVSETFDTIPFKIDITLSYYSTLFHTNNRTQIVMQGNITQYKNKTLGWYTNYPSVALSLGGSVGGEGYCGIRVMIDDCCVVSDFLGYYIENDVRHELESASFASTFSGAYTSDGLFEIDECTLPIIFDCASQDELDAEYMFFSNSSVYGIPELLQFSTYSPTSVSKYLTKQLCEDHIINFSGGEVSPEGQEFRLEVQWTVSTWINDNQPAVTGQPYIQGVKGKITNGKLALYKIDGVDDGKLKYGIKNTATFYDLEYTTDGVNWTQTSVFPFEFIYRKRVNELGTFGYALSVWNTDVPIWKNEDDADDYINDEKPIEESENWDAISPQYPPQNPTGLPEIQTEFGEVFTRNIFSQLYLCDVTALYEISNALFDYDVTTLSGLWADIKKGLEMYGSDPMEVVQGLRYYPFDLSQYFTSVQSQNYIYFGAYQLQLERSNVQKLIYCNGYIDLGSVDIKRSYNDWRDFEPYTKLSIYLPYVGTFPLDAKKYYGKSVNIRYFIDLRTGACTACLIANGVLLDWFDGIIGTEMPITLTDYSSYAQSQLNIIMRNAGMGIAAEGMSGNVISKVMKGSLNYVDNANAAQAAAQSAPLSTSLAAQTGAQYAGVAVGAAVVGSAALVGGVAVGTAMKTSFDMMRSGTAAHTKTRPASSAMINQYLPQYPYFRFEIMEIDESPYLNELYGRPSNASGIIANFRGYLEAEDIMLICPIATDNERQEIIDLVRTGIYI